MKAPTELYLGKAKRLGKQLEYADAYDIPLAILVGSQEKEQGVVTIKNMAVGRAKAAALGARDEWLAARPGQTSVARGERAVLNNFHPLETDETL